MAIINIIYSINNILYFLLYCSISRLASNLFDVPNWQVSMEWSQESTNKSRKRFNRAYHLLSWSWYCQFYGVVDHEEFHNLLEPLAPSNAD